MRLRLGFALVLISCFASPAVAADIRIMWDPRGECYWCEGQTPVNQSGAMYILATTAWIPFAGLTGAELRVDDFPSDWITSVVPSSASNFVTGDPLHGGCQIAFPTCQIANDVGFVLLYTVEYFATSTVTNRTISVWRHSTPSNPNFTCPLIILCDEPVFTKLCVYGVPSMLNRTIAIDDRSWSHVKALYE